MFFLIVLLCCWIRSRNIRQSRACHGQLLDLLRSSSGRASEPLSEPRVVPSKVEPLRKTGPAKSAPASYPDPARWLRTPSGWTSVPEAYVPNKRKFPRLPYPEFPPVLYHGSHFNHPFSQCGIPGCGRDSSSTVPGLVWTTIGERIPAVSSSWIHQWGPVGPLLPAGPSGSPSPLSQQSATGPKGPSPARPLGLCPPAPGGILCPQLQSTLVSTPPTSFSSTSKPQGQGSTPTPPSEERRIVPSASVKDYNRSVSNRPGSVFGLRVHFWMPSAFFICSYYSYCRDLLLRVVYHSNFHLIPKKNCFISAYLIIIAFGLFKIISFISYNLGGGLV